MKVSEIFYALQGEGPCIGIPAVFIRLAGCNLNCGFCDSVKLWQTGEEYTSEALANKVIELAGLDNLENFNTHLVITGGEPLLHVVGLSNFLDNLFAKVRGSNLDNPKSVFVEIETNGTIEANRFYRKYVTQVNCSPKLANSDEPFEKRVFPDALKSIVENSSHAFKFVVSSEADWKEIEETYVPYIGKDNIYLMPKANNREELLANSPMVWDMATREHVAMSTRLHMVCWDVKTGV